MENKTIVSTDRQRAIYAQALSIAKSENRIVTPSHLRIEQTIANGKNKYIFSMTKDSNSDSVTEKKLDRNDKFLVTHVGMMLVKRLSTLKGGEVVQSYPNPVVFADDSTNFIGAHLEVLYNGKLSFAVGQVKWIEDLDTLSFRRVPDAQQTAAAFAAINASGAEANSAVIAAATKAILMANSGFSLKDTLVELTPQITIDGDQKTEITIEAPVDANHKIANTVTNTSNIIVLFVKGFLLTRK
jgi:hypothetical protein